MRFQRRFNIYKSIERVPREAESTTYQHIRIRKWRRAHMLVSNFSEASQSKTNIADHHEPRWPIAPGSSVAWFLLCQHHICQEANCSSDVGGQRKLAPRR